MKITDQETFYLKVLNFRQLVGIQIQINDEESSQSTFQLCILQSRQMIHENSDLLVSAQPQNSTLVAIITRKFYNSGVLQNFVKAHNMTVSFKNHILGIIII